MGNITKFHTKWDKTKKEYEALVGKKPNQSILSKFRIRHTGITAALVKGYDATVILRDAMHKVNPKKATQALAAVRAAHAAYLGVKASYMVELNKALADARGTMKTDEKSVQERALKFLAKELDAIASEWEGQIAVDSEIVKAGFQAELMEQAMVASWAKQIRGGIDRAVAEIAKVKANPTAVSYNARIWKAARDLAPDVTRAETFKVVGVLARKIAPRLNKYVSNNLPAPAQLPGDADKAAVLSETAIFSQIIKEVAGLPIVASKLK